MFEVTQFNKGLYSLEFRIEDSDFKGKFEHLARKLESMNYVCKLELLNNEKYLIIQRFAPKKQRKWLSTAWTPRILFGVVVTFVMIDGYYRTAGTNSIIDIGDPLEMAGIYTLSLLGILGIHELGHITAARIHRFKNYMAIFYSRFTSHWKFPHLVAFIQSRGLTINREILFDVAIAGPIAGLVIAIIVSVYGAYTAPILEEDIARGLFAESRLN